MSRMAKPIKPTPMKKLLFRSTAINKKHAIAEAVKAYFRARGEKPKRFLEGKELQNILKEVFVLDSFKYDTSTGTFTMEVQERYFDDRMSSYKDSMEKYRKAVKKPSRTPRPKKPSPRRSVGAEKVFKAGIKREPDWLYYLDKNCNIVRSRMVRGGQRKNKADKVEMVVKTDIKSRDQDYLYFIDKQGDVARTRMSLGGSARRKRRKKRLKR